MTSIDARATLFEFSFGRVVSNTFGVIGRNFAPFFVLTLIAALPQTVIMYTLGQMATFKPASNPAAPFAAFSQMHLGRLLVAEILAVVLIFFLQATLTYATILDLNGKRATLGDAFAIGMKTILPLLGIAILMGAGIGLGLVLLIVPGLMLLMAWSVVVPVFVVEHPGILGSFGRSAELTRGHRWQIFGLFVIFFVLVILVDLITRPFFGLSIVTTKFSGFPVTFIVFQTIVRMITSVISATGTAAVYYELRTGKEGVGPDQLASVFE